MFPYCAQVKAEDLKVFDNVAYINASINSLSLGDYSYISCRFTFQKISCILQEVVTLRKCFSTGSFSSFVSLRELNLALNGLCNMKFDAADFPHLEVR